MMMTQQISTTTQQKAEMLADRVPFLNRGRSKRDGRGFFLMPGSKEDVVYYGCDLMPQWDAAERTHMQLYETTSEGTPLGPVFDNLDDLCAYAAEHCTTFADWKASAEEWRAMLWEGFVHHREGNTIFM